MRMKFYCKHCGKVIYCFDKQVKAIVEFMEARQRLYKTLWNKSFDSRKDSGVSEIIRKNVHCCESPDIVMVSFYGYE